MSIIQIFNDEFLENNLISFVNENYKNILKKRKLKIIDIGGSQGCRYDIASLAKISDIDLMDLIDNDNYTKNYYKIFYNRDCTKLNSFLDIPNKYYDIVLTSHIIEDLPDNYILLKEMQRIGKTGLNFFPHPIFEFCKHGEISLLKNFKEKWLI